MSFGDTISKLKGGKSFQPDLLSLIDQEVVKAPQKFSRRRLRVALDNFTEAVEENHTEKMWAFLYELFQTTTAQDARATGSFHPSSLEGDCPRMLFYDLSGVDKSDRGSGKPNARLQKIFDLGSLVHLYLQLQLYKAGVLVQAELTVRDDSRFIYGHTDGLLNISAKNYILEIKTINSNGYSQIKKFGAKPEHKKQANFYAHEVIRINKIPVEGIIFLYYNKDTSEIEQIISPLEPSLIEGMNAKIDLVIASVKTKKTPERICRNAHVEAAVNCQWSTYCFRDKK